MKKRHFVALFGWLNMNSKIVCGSIFGIILPDGFVVKTEAETEQSVGSFARSVGNDVYFHSAYVDMVVKFS